MPIYHAEIVPAEDHPGKFHLRIFCIDNGIVTFLKNGVVDRKHMKAWEHFLCRHPLVDIHDDWYLTRKKRGKYKRSEKPNKEDQTVNHTTTRSIAIGRIQTDQS